MAKGQATTTEPMLYGVTSHIGGRPNLEDRAHAETVRTAGGLTLMVLMVADGIGGNVQGERAAELAIQTVFSEVRASPIANAAQLPLLLAQALQRANSAVFEEGRTDRSRRGMGTTAVLAAIHNNQLYLANIGDSRAYLIRDGQASQITRDHTWAFEMHRQRLLTEAEIAKHPKRHELVRSIGYGSTVDVDLGIYNDGLEQEEREAAQNQGLLLRANDRLVLCSDGLIKEQHGGVGPYVSTEEMARIATQHAPEAAAKALVARALARHADDNVSAVVAEMPGSKRAAAAPRWLPLALGGVALLLVVGALAFFLLRGGGSSNPTPVAEQTSVAPAETAATVVEPSPTLPAAVAGQIQVLNAIGGRWEAGDTAGLLTTGTPVALPEGQSVSIVNDAGVAQLLLPNGARLFLEAGAAISVVAGAAGAADFSLDGGRVLVSSGTPVNVGSLIDARAALPAAGLLGLYLEPGSLLFEAACLQGECDVAGAEDAAPLRLLAGAAALVGNANRVGPPEPADYAAYSALAPDLVPRPTETPTATPTEPPTATPTRRQPTPTRPAAATPTRPATGPSPTAVPVETEESGGGNNPSSTDTPKPPATDTPEPPPTVGPTPED